MASDTNNNIMFTVCVNINIIVAGTVCTCTNDKDGSGPLEYIIIHARTAVGGRTTAPALNAV